MNGKRRFSIGFLKSIIVFSGIFLFALQGFAGSSNIYKWKDEQGKVHFTDDPLKIPSNYRSPSNVEKRRGLPAPKRIPSRSPVSPGQEEKKDAPKDLNKKVGKEADPEVINEDDEQDAMQDALNFLKSDIQRYKKYEDYVPQKRHAVLLRNDIVEVLPEKEALEQKLEKYDLALIKDLRSFLKKSLQRDYEAKAREFPRRLAFSKERSRINEELPEKNKLVEKLEAELASLPGKGPAQSESTPQGTGSKVSGEIKQDPDKEEAGPSNTAKY